MSPDDSLHAALHARGADAAGRVPGAMRHRPWLLIGGAAMALAVLLVVVVGASIDRGWQFGLDRSIMLAMRHGTMHGAPIGPYWLKPTMVDITALGGVTVVTLVTIVTTGFLAVRRLWLTMALVLASTISGAIAVSVVKSLVARPRPTLIDHLVEVSSASFPSGHATNSAIIYLTIATLLTQIVEERASRRYILIVAALLVTAIGCSRVYLGVHWPSDVLTGWCFGTLWAAAWWSVGAWARLRRAGRSVADLGK